MLELPKSANEWADYWYYDIGVNVIPAVSIDKIPIVKWLEVPELEGGYQKNPIPEATFNEWKNNNSFKDGMAVICGSVWRGTYKGQWLNMIDLDNKKSIEKFCLGDIRKVSAVTLIEQHKNPDKAHLYYYTERPVKSKVSNVSTLGNEINKNEIPAIEVKSNGNLLSYCTPSPHKDGSSYQFLTHRLPQQVEANYLELTIESVCSEFKIPYLETSGNTNLPPISDIIKEDFIVYKGENRHVQVLRYMDSKLAKNQELTDNDLLNLADSWMTQHCDILIPREEVKQKLLPQVRKFVTKTTKTPEEKLEEEKKKLNLYADQIMKEYNFQTMQDTEEIYYYKDGVYVPYGHIVIKIKCQKMIPDCTKYEVNEVLAIIQRKTYTDRALFNTDLSKLSLENGILDLKSFELLPHTPEFLTTIKIPAKYDPLARCPKFIKFLKDCLETKEKIITALELASNVLTTNKKNFEVSSMFIGGGANGKSTYLKILGGVYGSENCAGVSLHAMQDERFAIANLYGKLVNIHSDISSEEIKHLGPFKQLNSGDELQAEKKNQPHFKFKSFAKHFFSANEMPDIKDNTDAAFRRFFVLKWTTLFERGVNRIEDYDQEILKDEKNGIFNLFLENYKKLMRQSGFSYPQTVEDVRNVIKRESDKIREFVETCLTKDENKYIPVENLHEIYVQWVSFKKYGEPVSKQQLGVKLPVRGLSPSKQVKIQKKNTKVWPQVTWNLSVPFIAMKIGRDSLDLWCFNVQGGNE